VPIDDVEEVSCYVAAMKHGLDRIRGGFPLSLRLIREIHEVLHSSGRGSTTQPGEFRRSQNWVGGSRPGDARFVPPPPERLMECLGALEKFLHDDPVRTPILVKAALAHVQFETIHPFLDGNGRLGRLLITLLLCSEGALSEPLLYLSLYFKTHRDRYYELLQRVRDDGDWESWLRFFFAGVHETAHQAVETAKAILATFEQDRRRIEELGRPSGSALRVHEALKRKPLTPIAGIAQATGLSTPTVTTSLNHLRELAIVRELTGKRRGRLFVYDGYVSLLAQGTEPIKP
jgi:Fic family protein